MKQKTNILMTGAGAPGAAGILRCLKQDERLRIFACDANEHAIGKYLNQDFIQIPKADDPSFAHQLLKICLDNDIKIVMPLVTRELLLFAETKPLFEEYGIHVLVSAKPALEIANDKGQLYEFLESKNIAVPKFRIAKTFEEFSTALVQLGYPSKKVCFKPCVSNGSRGFRIIDDSIDAHDLLFNHKPDSTFISFESAVRILKSKPFPPLLLSEVLPGDEYSVDCLIEHGKAKLIVPRLRTKMLGGISVAGEFVKDEKIIKYCKSIIEAIGLHGNIGVQVKANEQGEFRILEINPRVQGTIVAGLGAGINLPLLAVKQELGWEIKDSELNVKWGMRFARFWDEVFFRE